MERRTEMRIRVDAGGVHIEKHAAVTHPRTPSRLERLGAVLDRSWIDPPKPLTNVQELGQVEFPDGSVVVQATHADGRVTTWSRGPDGPFQRRLRGLSQAIFGRAC